MKEVELSYGEVNHLEMVHRHSSDAATRNVVTSILKRTHEVEGGEIRYETICNHDERRDATEEEREKYGQSGSKPERVCENCGTMWDHYTHVIRQREELGP